MRFGFVLPMGDARVAADCARDAEQAGWDGYFVADVIWGIDAWVSLTAAAMVTQRIRLGTMLSPLSRMRPWKVASETATLDNLSNGRVVLSVGMGAIDTGYAEFGEVVDRKTRAELLDESLDIVTGLWQGQPFNYAGKHYHVRETDFSVPPPPVQKPRIPIWVVGAWPREKSMRRALRYDGLLPNVLGSDGNIRTTTPDDIRQIRAYVETNRQAGGAAFDIVVEGTTPGDDRARGAEIVRSWENAGATWWIEAMWSESNDAHKLNLVRERIRQGPPRT